MRRSCHTIETRHREPSHGFVVSTAAYSPFKRWDESSISPGPLHVNAKHRRRRSGGPDESYKLNALGSIPRSPTAVQKQYGVEAERQSTWLLTRTLWVRLPLVPLKRISRQWRRPALVMPQRRFDSDLIALIFDNSISQNASMM